MKNSTSRYSPARVRGIQRDDGRGLARSAEAPTSRVDRAQPAIRGRTSGAGRFVVAVVAERSGCRGKPHRGGSAVAPRFRMGGEYSRTTNHSARAHLLSAFVARSQGCRRRPYFLRVILVVSAGARARVVIRETPRREDSRQLSERRSARSLAAISLE